MKSKIAALFMVGLVPIAASATTLTVNSTDDVDDGTCDAIHCSFREAIVAGNMAGGVGLIEFGALPSGEQTIAIATVLPEIWQSVTIDGSTHPDGGIRLCKDGYSTPGMLRITAGTVTIYAVELLDCTVQSVLLTVLTAGSGSGTITGSPAGIDCGVDCSQAYDSGTEVTLTATADPGSTFAGWSGDADCGDGIVTLVSTMTCTASFDLLGETCVGLAQLDSWSTIPASGYALVDLLVGERVYTDRQYTVSGFDQAFSGGTLLQTANGDKNVSTTSHVTMTLCVDAVVYVAYDQRATSLPSWMAGPEWSLTSLQFSSTDGNASPMNVYRAVFPEGQVVLGGNDRSGTGARSHYSVVVQSVPLNGQLSVSRSGTGSGMVTSSPPGIDCGADCSEVYDSGTEVTLTATADPGSTFAGWSGDADCGDGIVTISSDVACTASFDPSQHTLTVAKNGAGSGTVVSSPAGIDCGVDCSEAYDSGTAVTLTAAADTGSTFAGWSGDPDCADGSVTATTDLNCIASFSSSQLGVGISAPVDGAVFPENSLIALSGTASDASGVDLTAGIEWTSNKDGTLGTGGSVSAVLSKGNHQLTASVSDSAGNTGSASVQARVRPNHRLLSDLTLEGQETYDAGVSITAVDVRIIASGEATFSAGETVALGDGFRVESGGSFVAANDPSMVP